MAVDDGKRGKAAFFGKTSSWIHKGKPKHDLPMSGKTWTGAPELDQSSGNGRQRALDHFTGILGPQAALHRFHRFRRRARIHEQRTRGQPYDAMAIQGDLRRSGRNRTIGAPGGRRQGVDGVRGPHDVGVADHHRRRHDDD